MRSRKEECLPFAERSTGLEKGERELRIVNQKKEVTGGKRRKDWSREAGVGHNV